MKKQLEIYTAILLSNNKPINSRDIAKNVKQQNHMLEKQSIQCVQWVFQYARPVVDITIAQKQKK